jgi:hypothetical protein
MAFTQENKSKPAENLYKHVKLGNSEAHLNILGESNNEAAISFEAREESAVDFSKVKVSKQFKLASYLPKLKSVPATPQFFDMAGGYITYPDAEVEAKKYEIQGGMFSAISGFFG